MNQKLIIGITALASMALTAQAATLTWDNGGTGSDLDTADNWDPNQAPSSGNDSLSFVGGVTVIIDSEFTVGSGQSFSGFNESSTNQLFRVKDGADITVATGGSLDLTGGAGTGTGVSLFTESGSAAPSGRRFTVESGATFKVDRYLTHNDWTTEFIASETGVATMEVLADLRFRNSDTLLIDLTNYNVVDTVNGDTLVLFDYGSVVGTAATLSVLGYDAADWTLNYAYDIGGGDLGVAITVIPEPGTYALLGGLLALSYVMVRRRS